MKLKTYFVFNPELKPMNWVDSPIKYKDKIVGKIKKSWFNRKTNRMEIEFEVNEFNKQLLIDEMKIHKYSVETLNR